MNLLTVEDIAARLKLHPVNVRTMLRRGELGRALRIGRCWRVDERDLEEALRRFEVNPTPRRGKSAALAPKKEYLDLLRPRPAGGSR